MTFLHWTGGAAESLMVQGAIMISNAIVSCAGIANVLVYPTARGAAGIPNAHPIGASRDVAGTVAAVAARVHTELAAQNETGENKSC